MAIEFLNGIFDHVAMIFGYIYLLTYLGQHVFHMGTFSTAACVAIFVFVINCFNIKSYIWS